LVQVINARHVTLMGRKMTDKKYYWHTNHPGGLKTRTPKQLMEKDKSEDVSGCHGR
jgi:large subunit ribosomal protein L13